MRVLLLAAGITLANAAVGQTLAPVDPAVADRFTKALVAGDDATISDLLSDKVVTNVTLQLGPDGTKRELPAQKGKAKALELYHQVLMASASRKTHPVFSLMQFLRSAGTGSISRAVACGQ